MKKNSFILWSGSLIIVFLTGYLAQITDSQYPLTSTFGIEGKKVSYRLEKSHYGQSDFETIIRSDIDGLEGKIFWKALSDSVWTSSELMNSGMDLIGKIPPLKPERRFNYFIELYHHNRKFVIPADQNITLTFYGKIPVFVGILRFILLYLGMVLGVRTGLEFFNNNLYSRKFGVMLLIIFIALVALINPLYITYKSGYINSSVPAITELFPSGLLIILFIWIATVIFMFTSKKLKVLPVLSAIMTLIIFLAVK